MFPLHLAALSGFSDCCRKLLSSGERALTQPFTVQKDTSLIFECFRLVGPNILKLHNIWIICRILFIVFYSRAGFDIDTPDDFGRTCLHAAAAGG